MRANLNKKALAFLLKGLSWIFLILPVLFSIECRVRKAQANTKSFTHPLDTLCSLGTTPKSIFSKNAHWLTEESLSTIGKEDSSIYYNTIIYEALSLPTGHYHGILITMDTSFSPIRTYIFSNNDKFKYKVVDIPKEITELNLRQSLESNWFYMRANYVSDGGHELLTWMNSDTLVNGILYMFCRTSHIGAETRVEEKKYLELLAIIRKLIVEKKYYR